MSEVLKLYCSLILFGRRDIISLPKQMTSVAQKEEPRRN